MKLERLINDPTVLNSDELNQVIQAVAPQGKEYGAARICRLLAQYHSVPSGQVNRYCFVSNISALVREAINPRIEHLNLYVACEKPPKTIYNALGQPTGQMLWSFFRDVAANDAVWWDTSHLDAEMMELGLNAALGVTEESFTEPPREETDDLFIQALVMGADLEEAS